MGGCRRAAARCSPPPASCRSGRAGRTSSSGTGCGPSPCLGRRGCALYARSGADITTAYPELAGLGAALAGAGITDAVLDGEIVAAGRRTAARRSRRWPSGCTCATAAGPGQLAATQPVTYMIFDVLSAERHRHHRGALRRASGAARVARRAARRRGPVGGTAAASPTARPRWRPRSEPRAWRAWSPSGCRSVYRPGRALARLDQDQARTDRRLRGRRLAARPARARCAAGRHARPGRACVYRGRVGGGISAAADERPAGAG